MKFLNDSDSLENNAIIEYTIYINKRQFHYVCQCVCLRVCLSEIYKKNLSHEEDWKFGNVYTKTGPDPTEKF